MFIAIIVLAVLFLYIIVVYNGLTGSKLKVEEAFASIDANLQQRLDNITELAQTVAQYAKHEKETLSGIISLRNSGYAPKTLEEKIELEQKLTKGLNLINALSENYPDLKANENFNQMQRTINVIEDNLTAARRAYNASVKSYNTKLQVFPNNLVVGMFGGKFIALEMFKADEEAKKRVDINNVFNQSFGGGKEN